MLEIDLSFFPAPSKPSIKLAEDEKDTASVQGYPYAVTFDSGVYTAELKKEPHILVCVVSEGNYKQNFWGMMQFANGINDEIKCGSQIKGVYVINTMYLHRFYDHKYGDPGEISKRSHELVNQLQRLQVPYKIIDWKSLTQGIWDDRYKTVKKQIDLVFSGSDDGDDADEEFRGRFNSIVGERTSKTDVAKEKIIRYSKDECIVSCLFKELIYGNKLTIGLLKEFSKEHGVEISKGYVTYPGKLNGAIHYITEKLGLIPPFFPYKVKEKHIKYAVKVKSAGTKKNFAHMEEKASVKKFESPVAEELKFSLLGFAMVLLEQQVTPSIKTIEEVRNFKTQFFQFCIGYMEHSRKLAEEQPEAPQIDTGVTETMIDAEEKQQQHISDISCVT